MGEIEENSIKCCMLSLGNKSNSFILFDFHILCVVINGAKILIWSMYCRNSFEGDHGWRYCNSKKIHHMHFDKSPLTQRSVYPVSKEFLVVLTKSLPQPSVNHLPNMNVCPLMLW